MRRLEELRQEEAAIRAAFPELFRGRPAPAAGTATAAATSDDAARRRRRWKMSAAQKRAVSERMRKYWAAKRKAKSG
jgi:hypothetical protein